MKTLPKELRCICARIALEQSRQAQCDSASVLRKEALAMLTLGKDAALVNGHLDGLLLEALKTQGLTVDQV
jgi:hypothetical protein